MYKQVKLSPQVLLAIIAGYFFLLGVGFTLILADRIEAILTPDYQTGTTNASLKAGELTKECKSDDLKVKVKIPVNWSCETEGFGEQFVLISEGPNGGQITSLSFTNDFARGSGCGPVTGCRDEVTYNKSGIKMTRTLDEKGKFVDWMGTFTTSTKSTIYFSALQNTGDDVDKAIINKILDTFEEIK